MINLIDNKNVLVHFQVFQIASVPVYAVVAGVPARIIRYGYTT